MSVRDRTIQRRLTAIILVASGAVLLVTCAVFITYEIISIRRALAVGVVTRARIVAANSTAALAATNAADARGVLAALGVDAHTSAAGLYDARGRLFATYPADAPSEQFPARPERQGHRFEAAHLIVFQPVRDGSRLLGTVYVKYGLGALRERYRFYAALVLSVIVGCLLLAAALSSLLQRQISAPLLRLAETARAVSSRRDYSLRAPRLSGGEIGLLAESFNDMLAQIQAQTQAAGEQSRFLDSLVDSLPGVFYLFDDQGRFLRWNKNFERVTGYSAGEIARMHPRDFFIGTDQRHIESRILEVFAQGQSTAEAEFVFKDGNHHPYFFTGQRVILRGMPHLVGLGVDIAERKRAEEALRESQQLLQAIIDNSTACVYVKDLEGRYLLINRRWEELFHTTREAVRGKTDYDVFPKERAEAFRAFDRRVLQAGAVLEAEELAPHDGGLHTYLSIKSPIFDTAGRICGLCGISTDITDRKRAEEALRESEERFRTVADFTQDWEYWVGVDGRHIYVSPSCERVTGYRAEEFMRDPRLLQEIVHPDDRALLERHLHEPSESEHALAIDFRIRTRGGEWRWMSHVCRAVYGADGRWLGRRASNRDITDRKRAGETLRESEERFRALVTASSDVVYRMSPDWTEMRQLRGRDFIADTEAPSNTWLERYIHPKDQPRVLAAIQEAIRTKSIFALEHQVLRVDGSLGWTFSRAVPLLDARGEIVEWFGAASDITARKQAEEQVQQLNQQLEQRVQRRTAQLESANKELEAFCYSVSHDLRAPLRHIDGFVGLLNRSAGNGLSDQSRYFLNTIADSARQMGRLIDDLLVFSRMGRAEMRQTRVDLRQLVEETIASLQPETQGRNVVWKKNPLPEAHADPAMLRQVFVNLLSNAVKYTRPRDPAEIEIGWASDDGGEIVVFVRDNGVGFDMEYADKLFGVFQRLHNEDDFEGTGIGLANVRRIISRHGGRTWAAGKVDAGATFYFSLPNTHAKSTA